MLRARHMLARGGGARARCCHYEYHYASAAANFDAAFCRHAAAAATRAAYDDAYAAAMLPSHAADADVCLPPCYG